MSDERIVKSSDTERENRVPPGQKITDNWPVLHLGSMPDIDINKWTFTISGLVERRRELSFEEFMSLPRIKVFSDIHCVTGWSKLDNLWEGISATVIRDLVVILPDAKFVTVYSVDGFTTNLSLSDFFAGDVLFAVKHDGELLARAHGYPVRLIVPRLYLWKSAKWVARVEFTGEDKPGFWESRGYHNRGDPWQEERYG